jgi:hypothetical protein
MQVGEKLNSHRIVREDKIAMEKLGRVVWYVSNFKMLWHYLKLGEHVLVHSDMNARFTWLWCTDFVCAAHLSSQLRHIY